ncbi:hypothetical protein CPB86DRAFT_763467, partial [Serendipita vermifera]
MSVLILKETSVTMSNRDGRFFPAVSRLILEVACNGKVVDKVNLLPRKSSPGVWDADDILVLHDRYARFTVSVSRRVDRKPQVVAFIELDGSKFYDGVRRTYEMPLMHRENYPCLRFKARSLGVEDLREFLSLMVQFSAWIREDTIKEIVQDARAAGPDYEQYWRPESLYQTIVQLQYVIDMVNEDHPELPNFLNILGTCLLRRFEWLGDPVDINDSAAQLEAAIKLTPKDHPNRPNCFNNLGNTLRARFEQLGSLADIDNAITSNRMAVNLIPEGHPDKPHHLINLGNSLGARFERLGNLADLDDAIASNRVAVNLTSESHLGRPSALNNLGICLQARFKRLGNLADIDDAIASKRAALKLTPEGHPDKPRVLNNLGTSLQIRFERLRNLADLDDAITSNQAAVDLIPEGRPGKASVLNNLGCTLQTRFERLGNIADIDSAITSNQAAVDLIPEGRPGKASVLNNLGCTLQTRFERLGNIADIDDAIMTHRAALNLTPEGHPDKPRHLISLGAFLQTRFERLKKLTDLEDAIALKRAALNLTPESHPDKLSCLTNLGVSLLTRFEQLGNLSDLDDAIASNQEAVNLTPEGHPDKPRVLKNLGTSLQTRFERLQSLTDLENAILSKQAAVNLMPNGHHNFSSHLNSLAFSLIARFNRLGHSQDENVAISTLSTSAASRVSPPIQRLEAARMWSSISSFTGHSSLLDAYGQVIDLMPLVAWLGLPISNRHHHLVQIGGITRDAAAAAISFGQYLKALEWLEQGRSIVWNQILQLRTPVDDLREVKPEFAEHLVQISRVLDQGREYGHLDKSHLSDEERGRLYRTLTMERESIIDQVRSLPKFENFLRPFSSSQLTKITQEGPIVVLNIGEKHCDALALIPGLVDVMHILLPNLTAGRIAELANELKGVLNSIGIRMRGDR